MLLISALSVFVAVDVCITGAYAAVEESGKIENSLCPFCSYNLKLNNINIINVSAMSLCCKHAIHVRSFASKLT